MGCSMGSYVLNQFGVINKNLLCAQWGIIGVLNGKLLCAQLDIIGVLNGKLCAQLQFTHHFSGATEIQNSFLLLHTGNTPCRHIVLLNKVYYNDIKQCTGKNISNLTFQKISSSKLRLEGLLPLKIVVLPI